MESTDISTLVVVRLERDAFGQIVGRIAEGERMDVSFETTHDDRQGFVLTVVAPPRGSVVAEDLASLRMGAQKPDCGALLRPLAPVE